MKILVWCLALLTGCGCSSAFAAGGTPPPADEQLAKAGFNHFYSLEYDQAIAVFNKLRQADPGNPDWHNHVAASYFYKQLLVANVLQGDLFTSSNRFYRMKKIPPDPALRKGFWNANEAAVFICEERLKKNQKDEEALYACGVAYASRGTYQGLIDRSKLDTLASARKAARYHNELIRLNPGRYDAYLVPGVYEYVMGSLPKSLRLLLLLAGFSGNKEKGIHQVESAAERGNRASEDAKIFLTVIYRREKRFANARQTLANLAERFPRNYIFPLEIASLYRRAGEDEQAILAYREVLEDALLERPGYAETPLARLHFELAELYSKAGKLEQARRHLQQVPGSLGSTPELEQQSAEMLRQIEEKLQQQPPAENLSQEQNQASMQRNAGKND